MAEHTPAPWYAFIYPDGAFDVLSGPDECISPVICARNRWPKRAAESHANAHLIAASPELLAACRTMAAHCPCGGEGQVVRTRYDSASGEMEWDGFDVCDRCKTARAAIARAEGPAKTGGPLP